jgi:hypothetical protein
VDSFRSDKLTKIVLSAAPANEQSLLALITDR